MVAELLEGEAPLRQVVAELLEGEAPLQQAVAGQVEDEEVILGEASPVVHLSLIGNFSFVS